MKTPTTTKGKAKTTKAVKPTPDAKAEPRTPSSAKVERTTKRRRRPDKPFNLKVLYPKQPELRKAIFCNGSKGSLQGTLAQGRVIFQTRGRNFPCIAGTPSATPAGGLLRPTGRPAKRAGLHSLCLYRPIKDERKNCLEIGV